VTELKDFAYLLGSWVYAALTHKLVLLAIGGAIGTIARYSLAKWLDETGWGKGFPLGTFVINITGSFILGVAATVIMERLPPAHQNWYLLFGTGFCGGYTTFSTFEWETYRLVRDKSLAFALANIVGSVVVGFLGIVVAVALTNLILPKR
jgi:CrcB protein